MKCNLTSSQKNLKALCSLELWRLYYKDATPKVHMLESEVPLQLAKYKRALFGGAHERHAINNYYLRQFACIRNWCQRMRHIFVNRKLAKSDAEGTSRSSRGPSATLVQRLLRIERPRDQSMFLKERLSTYSFIARDILWMMSMRRKLKVMRLLMANFKHKFQFNFLRQ
jgi:hypothetical protein